jgi:hypothetical protein
MNVRSWLVVAAAAILTTMPAGCAKAAGPQVPTAAHQPSNPSGVASSPASPTESDYDKALRYTRCMTEHGETVPDPVEGKPLPLGGSTKGWATMSAAFEACRHFLPATWPVKADPDDIARNRPWGECMRQHGVEIPELNPDSNGMVHAPPDPTLYYTPQWRSAEAACRYLNDSATIPLTDG